MYETIFSPLSIGRITLKNRIVFAPTTLGLPEDEIFSFMERIAAGGAAMLILGDVPALDEGRSFGSPSPLSREGFLYYQKMASLLHSHGALACAQLHMSDTDMGAMRELAPKLAAGEISRDDLRNILNRQAGPFISGMETGRIETILDGFGKSAKKLEEAGFDLIQIHGDRMCGSFLSSLLNRRTDCFGGSLENRARFALESVRRVRAACPGMPIEFKLAVRMEQPRYGNAGVTEQEAALLIPLLEQAGVNCFHITLANHSSLSDTIPPANHPQFGEEGCFLRFCDLANRYTSLPVCGVGGLTDPDFVESQLKSGRIRYAAMSRQLIADPQWPSKVQSGNTSAIFRCVRCNRKCLDGLKGGQGVHCIYSESPG